MLDKNCFGYPSFKHGKMGCVYWGVGGWEIETTLMVVISHQYGGRLLAMAKEI